jgi:hypothetical protein
MIPMNRLLLPALFLGSALLAPGNPVLLKKHNPAPNEAVVIHVLSDSKNGAMSITTGTQRQEGTISITRKRHFERKLLTTSVGPALQYKMLSDSKTTIVKLGETPDQETTQGALVGRTIRGFQDDTDQWRLYLSGGSASGQQAADLAEIEAYENRQWFPASPVNIGQTWTFNPAFIRHLTERDLGPAKLEALMSLKAITNVDNDRIAILNFSIRSQNSKESATGKIASGVLASVDGTMHVSLTTMLDKYLHMTGSLTTVSKNLGQATRVRLPVNYTVTKTVIPATPGP